MKRTRSEEEVAEVEAKKPRCLAVVLKYHLSTIGVCAECNMLDTLYNGTAEWKNLAYCQKCWLQFLEKDTKELDAMMDAIHCLHVRPNHSSSSRIT